MSSSASRYRSIVPRIPRPVFYAIWPGCETIATSDRRKLPRPKNIAASKSCSTSGKALPTVSRVLAVHEAWIRPGRNQNFQLMAHVGKYRWISVIFRVVSNIFHYRAYSYAVISITVDGRGKYRFVNSVKYRSLWNLSSIGELN